MCAYRSVVGVDVSCPSCRDLGKLCRKQGWTHVLTGEAEVINKTSDNPYDSVKRRGDTLKWTLIQQHQSFK